MRKGNKFKLLAFLSLLIGCASGAKTLIVDASIEGPNGKDAPKVQFNDVATYDVNYYSSIKGLKKDDLLEGLATISQQNHRYFNTYAELWGGNCYSDADKNDPNNKLIDFYTQLSISNEYQTSKTHPDTYDPNKHWNREHVWCQSHSGGLYGTSGAGSDIHHIRPNVANINSSRNNSPYGEVEDDFAVFYNETEGVYASSSTGTLYGYLNNNVFEPIKNVKGDVARIVMYMYMHYSKEVSSNSSYKKAGALNITNIVHASDKQACKDLLIKWNEEDPVDKFESDRNDYCASVTGLRNPFIDHPEFARIMWDTSYSGNGALEDENGGSETPSYYLNLVTSSAEIEVGQTYQIQVNTNIPTLSYTSSNQAVASVNQSGLITSETAGTSIITISGNSISKQFSLTVNEKTSSEEPETPSTSQSGWQLVDDVTELEINDKVIIAAKESNVAMSTEQKSNNRGQASIKKDGTTLEEPSSSVQQFTLEEGTTTNTFAFNTGEGYLYAASSSNNYLKTQSTKDANGSWKIEIETDGTATIKSCGTYTRNTMQYNQTSSLFACYSSASQKALCLYKYVEETNEDIQPELKFDIATNAELGFKANYTTTTTSTTQTTAQYEKVTTAPSDWSGEYLIVYETDSIVFNGALTTLDASGNGANVTINNGVIEANAITNSMSFEISKDVNNYLIKSASCYYIGATSNSNSLLSNNTTKYTNTISLNSDKTVNIIGSGGAYLRYNATSGQDRFRYYKSSTYSSQKAICLYKKVGGEGTKAETTWEFSDYQLRFSSTFTSDLVLDETYPMESLTFGYVITPKKFLDNNGYVSFEDAYKSNDNDLNKVKTLLKAKTDTLSVTNINNNYTFGFILKGITNVNAEYSVSFYVKTQEGDIYFSTTKSTSISSIVDRYLSNDSILDNYDNKSQILLALNAMKEQFS